MPHSAVQPVSYTHLDVYKRQSTSCADAATRNASSQKKECRQLDRTDGILQITSR